MKKSIGILLRKRTLVLAVLVLLVGVLCLAFVYKYNLGFSAPIQMAITGVLIILVAYRIEIFGSRQARHGNSLNSRLLQVAYASNQTLTLTKENLQKIATLQSVSNVDMKETQDTNKDVSVNGFGDEIVAGESFAEDSDSLINEQILALEKFLLDVDKNQKSIVNGLSFLQLVSIRREISALKPEQIYTTYGINDGNILHSTANVRQFELGQANNLQNWLNGPTVIIVAEDELGSIRKLDEISHLHDVAIIVCGKLENVSDDFITPSNLTEVVPSGVSFRVRTFVPVRLAVSRKIGLGNIS